jgi:TolB-like protein
MKYLIPLLLVISVVLAQATPKTVVFSFTTVGVDEASGITATSIFRTELANTGKFDVIESDVIKTTLGNDEPVEGISTASENANKLGAVKAVIGSLSKLGNQTLVEVKLIDVATANVEFSDRLGTATGADIDVMLARLAKGVAERKKTEATAEVGKITEKEAAEPARRASFWSGGAKIGYFFPLGGFGDDPGQVLGGSSVGLYETPSFMAEAAFSYFFIGGKATLWTGGFSVFKLLSKTDVCPYLGGGVGIGMVSGDYPGSFLDIGVGPVVNFGGGYMFLRTYDFRIVVDLRYYLSFCSVESTWDNEKLSSFQHGPSISVGLLYKRSKTEGARGCCCGFGF